MKILQVAQKSFSQLFQSLPQNTCGYLIGTQDLIFNFAKPLNTDDDQATTLLLTSALPIGLDIIGIYLSSDMIRPESPETMDTLSTVSNPPRLLENHKQQHVIIGDATGQLHYFHNEKKSSLTVIDSISIASNDSKEITSDGESFVLVNCCTTVQLPATTALTTTTNISFEKATIMTKMSKQVLPKNQSDEQKTSIASLLSKSTATRSKQQQNQKDGSSSDGDLAFTPPAPRESFTKFKVQPIAGNQMMTNDFVANGRDELISNTIQFNLYSSSSSSVHNLRRGNDDSNLILQSTETPLPVTNVMLNVFGYISPNMSLNEVRSLLIKTLESQIQFAAKRIYGDISGKKVPQFIYFNQHLPSDFYPHVLTTCSVFYTNSLQDEEATQLSISERSKYHDLFYFSKNVPLLRIGRALPFGLAITAATASLDDRRDSSKRSIKLNNVHLYAKPLPTESVNSNSTKLVTIKGPYTYHHYLQDGIQDDGWGCAYRSCQTLISYLKLNQLSGTNSPVPNIREMQQILVELGDKPASFLGSSQWIGAMENSYVINQVCNVDCKILNVMNRKDLLENHLRTLVRHFEDQGTPVMIGGGVLAYTLLGMLYDEKSADNVRFLILDPHYKGSDTVYYGSDQQKKQLNAHTNPNTASGLETIVRDGWCGWKKADQVFVENAFYNFCMPQVPNSL